MVVTDRNSLEAAVQAVASSPGGPSDLSQTLLSITETARQSIGGVDFASITIRHRSGRLETMAPSSPLMYVADGLQYELSEGPCYDAVTDDLVAYCPDLAHDGRWPRFGPRAAILGLGSLLAVRLAHPGATFMALNMYSDRVAAFGDHHKIVEIFLSAGSATAGPGQPGKTLRDELTGRTLVENATGILMHRHGVDAEHALLLLSELADRRRFGSDA